MVNFWSEKGSLPSVIFGTLDKDINEKTLKNRNFRPLTWSLSKSQVMVFFVQNSRLRWEWDLAKAQIHSVKPLPNATLGKGHMVNLWSAKGSLRSIIFGTLGKDINKKTQKNRIFFAREAPNLVSVKVPSHGIFHAEFKISLFRISLPNHYITLSLVFI